jgi:hypothetical protein
VLTLNCICNFLGVREVNYVAGACDFDRVAVGPLARSLGKALSVL